MHATDSYGDDLDLMVHHGSRGTRTRAWRKGRYLRGATNNSIDEVRSSLMSSRRAGSTRLQHQQKRGTRAVLCTCGQDASEARMREPDVNSDRVSHRCLRTVLPMSPCLHGSPMRNLHYAANRPRLAGCHTISQLRMEASKILQRD